MAAGPYEMRGYGERLVGSASELGPALFCIICRLVRAAYCVHQPLTHQVRSAEAQFIENLIVCLVLLFFFFKGTPLFTYLLIYLFLAVLGLRFRARAFSSCGKGGPLFIAARGPLTIAAFLVAEHRLQTRRLSSCGSRA